MFLKIGAFGFGGPIALINHMDQECVKKRNWVSVQEYQRLIGLCKLFPGPLATLIAIRLGCIRAGKLGGVMAGLMFILPAFFMILLLGKFAIPFTQDPHYASLWIGLNLSALGIAFLALLQLSKPLFQKPALPIPTITGIILVSAILTFLDSTHEAFFILGSGIIGAISFKIKSRTRPLEALTPALAAILFFSCFKSSFVTFGSGISIVPVLKAIFVDQHHWISAQDFLNGLTLGLITPGPLVITTTYLGYAVAGMPGAIITTSGIFIPTFILGLYLVPALEKHLEQMPTFQHFIYWVLPAVSGAILGSLIKLSLLSFADLQWQRILLLVVLMIVAVRFKLHTMITLLLGAVAALLFQIA